MCAAGTCYKMNFTEAKLHHSLFIHVPKELLEFLALQVLVYLDILLSYKASKTRSF